MAVATFALFGTSLLFSLLLGGSFSPNLVGPALIEVGLIWLLTAFYYLALSKGKVEETAPLLTLSAVFALALDWAMGNTLSLYNIAGVVLAFLGAFLLAWKGKVEAELWALLAALLIALRNGLPLFFRVPFMDFITTYSAVGLLLSLPFLLAKRDEGARAFIGPNVLNGLAFALLVLSLMKGSVALSTALSQLSALFVVLLAAFIFRSPISFFLRSLLAAFLLVVGALLCLL